MGGWGGGDGGPGQSFDNSFFSHHLILPTIPSKESGPPAKRHLNDGSTLVLLFSRYSG